MHACFLQLADTGWESLPGSENIRLEGTGIFLPLVMAWHYGALRAQTGAKACASARDAQRAGISGGVGVGGGRNSSILYHDANL